MLPIVYWQNLKIRNTTLDKGVVVCFNIDKGGEIMGDRRCIKCKEAFPLSYFFVDKHSKDGYQARCIVCVMKARRNHNKDFELERLRRKRYYESHKENEKLRVKEWRKSQIKK